MSNKERLIKLKNFIKNIESDNKTNNVINEDLKLYSKDELLEIYDKDIRGFSLLTKVYDLITLSDELLYLYLQHDNIINGSSVDIKTTIILGSLALVGLTGRTLTTKEHEDACNKMHILSLKHDEEV